MNDPRPQVEFVYKPVSTEVRASPELLYWFHNLLSIPNPDGWPPTWEFFNPSTRSIMSGHLHWLEQHLTAQGVPYAIHDRPPTMDFGDPDPRILSTIHHPDFVLKPFQVSTTRKMVMGQRGSVQLATGAGKTASFIAALKWIEMLYGGAPSLTVVPVNNLAKQMTHRMKNAGLNATVLRKGKWGKADHVVAVINGLYRALQRGDENILRLLHSRAVLCMDEAHHGQAEMCFTVANNCPAYYRWMLSATLYANRANPYMHGGDMRIMGISGPTLAMIPARFLWEHGHVAEPTIIFVPMLWPDADKAYGFRAGGRWVDTSVWRGTGVNAATTGVEWDLIVNNKYRNEFIRRLVYWKIAAEPETTKFVILVQRLDHGRILQKMLARVGIISTCCYGGQKVISINAHGDQREWVDHSDKTLEEFGDGRLRVIIGSQKFDEGQSFPMFTDLVLAQAGKGGEANRRVYQRVGRGLHSGIKVHVWDFYDQTHRMVQRQAETRLMALHNEGYPVQVDMPQECTWAIPGL